jgi:hypothetical protein
MADDASRLWYLTDSQLLAYFNHTYPQPLPWRLFRLSTVTKSALISACCGQHLMPESFLRAPAHIMKPGPAGVTSVTPSAPTTNSLMSLTLCSSSKSSPNDIVTDALPPATNRYDLALWRTPSARWARASPEWGPATLA